MFFIKLFKNIKGITSVTWWHR